MVRVSLQTTSPNAMLLKENKYNGGEEQMSLSLQISAHSADCCTVEELNCLICAERCFWSFLIDNINI